jgi:hypothetical protein
MSAKLNELRRNSTSRVPGLRLNMRRGHLVVDVTWYVAGQRRSTSYLVNGSPIKATERAMQRRCDETAAAYDITPRQAWWRLRETLR